MKKVYFFIAVLLFSATLLSAQDSRKVKLNNKTILNTTNEDEAANSKPITAAEWANNGSLEVCYKEKKPQKDWRRSIFFVDENDNELIRKDGVTKVKISVAELKQAFAGKKQIRIFTISLPTDPDLAARVRVRRVHLCTLELP